MHEESSSIFLREYIDRKCFVEKLEEVYRTTDLSFIEKFVDELYANADNYEEIGKKYNIDIELGGCLTTDTFICSSSYNVETKKFMINLSKYGIDYIDKNINKEILTEELYTTLTHEDTHRQQDQLDYKYQKYINADSSSDESLINYLSQSVEVDANARATAYYMLNILKCSQNCIIKNLCSKNLDFSIFPKSMSAYIFFYKEKISGKVWLRFLKQVYLYLEYPSVDGGKEEYKQWLLKHAEKKI